MSETTATDSSDRVKLERPAAMTHVALRTRDLDASIDFYKRYANLHIVHERVDDGLRVCWLSHRERDPNFVIVVLELPHEAVVEPAAHDHLGFDVSSTAEVDRIAELARSEGRLKYGPVHARPIVGYIAMVRDPSGVTCEFSHGQPIDPDAVPPAS